MQCSNTRNSFNQSSLTYTLDICYRIVTVNLLSDSVLTLTPYRGDIKRYNLELAPVQYHAQSTAPDVAVRVPMPRRSLLVLTQQARYGWEHFVLREDVKDRRVCLAYREFTPPYLPGGEDYARSEEVFKRAKAFW